MSKQVIRTAARTAAILGVAALLSVVVVSVAAAYKTGRYEGTTSQDEAVAFKAKNRGVKKLHFKMSIPCEDGSAYDITGGDGEAPTNDKGKFTARYTPTPGSTTTFTSVVKGKLKGKRGEGTIKTEGAGETGVTCAGSVDWSAKKQ